MKYTTRLYLGFGLIILVVTILLTIIVAMFNHQNDEINNLVEDCYEKIKLLNHIRVNIKSIDRDLSSFINHDSRNQNLQRIREASMTIDEDLNVLNRIIKIEDAKEQLSNINSQIKAYQSTVEQVIAFATIEDYPKSSSFYETATEQYENIIGTSELLISIQERIMEDTLYSADNSYGLYLKISLASIVLSLLLGFGISYWVIRNIKTRFQAVRDVMNSIQYGSENLPRIKVLANDEIGEIAHAYNEMAVALENHERTEREYTEEIEDQNWLSMQLAALSMLSQGIVDIKILGEKFLEEVVPKIEAQYGALYILQSNEGNSFLSKVSTYAGVEAQTLCDVKEDFQLGEGLIGQCAKDGQPKLITNIPSNYINISSALGGTKPRAILVLPIVLDDEVVGVLEIASLSEITDLNQKLLLQSTNQLGVAIYRINQQMKVKELLEESQALNEELQSQSEELQVQQEELQTVNEELEAQYKNSEQKTKDLEAIRVVLEARTKELQLNSKYKSEFLANMSHELRTPLNSLLILAQIMLENKEDNLNEMQKEYLGTIFAAGKDLLNIINDILDLAKIESGKLDVEISEMDISEVLSLTKNQFEILAKEKEIDFIIEVEPDVPTIIFTDKQKVLQILKNLVSNAIKFTEKGYVKLLVKKESAEGVESSYIAFHVKDTGIGIAKDNQKFIFEAFQQADGTTSRKYGGTGLGLSISKELAEILNGRITVASKEEEGSVFTFYLPASFSYEKHDTQKEIAITTDNLHPHLVEDPDHLKDTEYDQDLADKRVLIVDDDMRNIFSLTIALEAAGMKVSFAENGKEGIDFLTNHRDIDIVLMDIMMPEMDGFEAMRQIRQLKEFEHLPIVALTAKAMSTDRKKCIEAGASDYIPKPVNLEQLFSLLKVWLYK